MRQNQKDQFDILIKEKQLWENRCKAMAVGVLSILNLIEVAPTQPGAEKPPLVNRCINSWMMFKQFVHDTSEYVASHVLAIVRSHYPRVDLQRIEAGVAKDTNPHKAIELRDSSRMMALNMIADVDLCGKTGLTS
jgi:hypothetical protein